MKVGTDGVLLGAWAPIADCRYILDVGTGTGLIALQLAQRSQQAHIIGVEIDAEAAKQAVENVQHSPWPDRIQVQTADFRTYTPAHPFDLIVSNPPYFVDALQCPDSQRNTARHVGGLNYELLFRRSTQMITPTGIVAIVIPAEIETHVLAVAANHGFYIYHRLSVFTKPGKPCRRILLALGTDSMHAHQEEILYIEDKSGNYSPAYKALTGDFYLKM
ncbi:SAM-dependent methyltransferase [gut metagenome]|uniref:SAM-dependent methyltransferase n=1 Tax=gut metagenome TaxID=749906 RepID=J9BX11_9ZZZZ